MNNIDSNIPMYKIKTNLQTMNTNIPKSASVGLTQNYSNLYGSTILSNRTETRGALDNIKTKHQQSFGVGINTKRRTSPYVVN